MAAYVVFRGSVDDAGAIEQTDGKGLRRFGGQPAFGEVFESLCCDEGDVPVGARFVLVRQLDRLRCEGGSDHQEREWLIAAVAFLAQIAVKLAVQMVLQIDRAFGGFAVSEKTLVIMQRQPAIGAAVVAAAVTGYMQTRFKEECAHVLKHAVDFEVFGGRFLRGAQGNGAPVLREWLGSMARKKSGGNNDAANDCRDHTQRSAAARLAHLVNLFWHDSRQTHVSPTASSPVSHSLPLAAC